MRLFFILLLLPAFIHAQKLATIDEKTKEAKKHTGFINYYWDEATGKFLLEVDKLDHEFLYVTSLPAGLGSNDIGLDRGLLGDQKIVKFTKTGRKFFLYNLITGIVL
jgi:hypothetical protein